MNSSVSHITLTELTEQVKAVLLNSFSGRYFWVVGEISGHKYDEDKNRHYLDLIEKKDGQSLPSAKVKTNIWSDVAVKVKEFERLTGQVFKDGLQVLVKASVEFHILYGLTLVVYDIDASYTLGNLEKQRLQTLMRLVNEKQNKIRQVGEDYITPNKELNFNPVLQSIALVASPNSEGYHDFINNILYNHFSYSFKVDSYHTLVQGVSAEEELRNAMLKIFHSGIKYDCVVIIRGGGAKTDFAVFDTYGIAQVVARFPYPVITGIGHLRDVSITDLMAHTSTNAPTKAAEFILAHNRKFEDSIISLQHNILIKVQQFTAQSNQNLQVLNARIIDNSRERIQEQKDKLEVQKQSLVQQSRELIYKSRNVVTYSFSKLISSAPFSIKNTRSEMINLNELIKSFIFQFLRKHNESIEHNKSLIKIMDPKNILNKGFVLVKKNGKIQTDVKKICVGDELNIVFSDAEIATTVNELKDGKYEL